MTKQQFLAKMQEHRQNQMDAEIRRLSNMGLEKNQSVTIKLPLSGKFVQGTVLRASLHYGYVVVEYNNDEYIVNGQVL